MNKNKLIVILILVVIGLTGVSLYLSERVYYYNKYYNATENLLDTLNTHYDWVDAIDPYDYYESVDNL